MDEEKIKMATGFWLLATGKKSKWVDGWMRKREFKCKMKNEKCKMRE